MSIKCISLKYKKHPLFIFFHKKIHPDNYSSFVENDIGKPGEEGFGIGIYPATTSPLPEGFSEMEGTKIVGHTNYGNYQYKDGSVMCWIPKFYYKFSTGNQITVASDLDYESREEAFNEGFVLHRAFIDGGVIKTGFFYDKYLNSIGEDKRPVSVKNGIPFNFDSKSEFSFPNVDYLFPEKSYLVGFSKRRGQGFFTTSIFMHGALAFLSLAHGQASSDVYHCAWYSSGTTNFPKGCNTTALSDINDSGVRYEAINEENSNIPTTGSGFPFAKTTHNGQESGVADLNGVRWETHIGYAQTALSVDDDNETSGSSNVGYFLKDIIKISDLTGLWGERNGKFNAWGTQTHLVTLYDRLTTTSLIDKASNMRYGNGTDVEVFNSTDNTGVEWIRNSAGLPYGTTNNNTTGTSSGGTTTYGQDRCQMAQRTPNCVVSSGGTYSETTYAGIFAIKMTEAHHVSSPNHAYRCAFYA